MDPIKKMILPIFVFFLILAVCTPLTTAEQNQVITDDVDDVIFSDLFSENQEIISRPNVDIIKMTYIHLDDSVEATLILQVEGIIENLGFDIDDMENYDNFTGSLVSYILELETSSSTYEIDFINDTCSVNGETASFEIDGSELSIFFNLSTNDESYVSLIGYTMEIEIKSIVEYNMYMDIAPNEAMFLASISAPDTGVIGESISFSGVVEDMSELLGMSSSTEPYTYTWDWNDGSPDETGQNPTHVFNSPIPYDVELTVEDSTGLITTATHQITISDEPIDPNNGNGDNGDTDEPSDDDGSSMMLFLGVVIVIVIIGVIALLVVIKRR